MSILNTGGKQSISRQNNNLEFILIVDKDKKNSPRNLFSKNPQYAFNLITELLNTQIKKIEALMNWYHLEIPLRNMADFLKNVRLSFAQDTICNYCESNALNIIINNGDVATKIVKEWKLYPDPTGIPSF